MGIDLELRHPVDLHKLWRAASLIGCTWRRNHDDVSMGYLHCGMGHLLHTPMVAGTAADVSTTAVQCFECCARFETSSLNADWAGVPERLDVYRAVRSCRLLH